MKDQVFSHVSGAYPWKDHFHFLPQTDSTNDQLRTLARAGAPEGTVLLADRQTAGHGRRGRAFHSPAGTGIYMSILLRPQCAPTDLMHLTCATAVAMCDAVENSAGFRPQIKWINDLVFEKRKLGGILTELGFTPQGALDYAIVGIGINCCQGSEDFPQDIRDMAASLSMVAQRPLDREKVAAAMLEALHQMSEDLLDRKARILDRYRRDCITLGQQVVLIRGEEKRYGKAVDLDDQGALIVEFSPGQREPVNSGEVSVRGMYGYV